MADKNDEKILGILGSLPDDLNSASFLLETYSDLGNYPVDGPLAFQVSEALKRIRSFAEDKIKNIDIQTLTPEAAVKCEEYLYISDDSNAENKARNQEIRTAIEPKVAEYDQKEGIDDLSPETDVAANSEAWDKITSDIKPFEKITTENGETTYRVTEGFERFGGFFSSLDGESRDDILETARLEAVTNLAKKTPHEDIEAARAAYVEELEGILDQTAFQLWQQYQFDKLNDENPGAAQALLTYHETEEKLADPAAHISALSENEIKELEAQVQAGKHLNLTGMAAVAKSRPLLNKPMRDEMKAVIEKAAAAKSISGDDLVALEFLLQEVERVPEYKKINDEKTLEAARLHRGTHRDYAPILAHYQRALGQQTVNFDANTFSNRNALKNAVAVTVTTRTAALVRKAERMSFKTGLKKAWSKVREWDAAVAKKYPTIYPMAKSMATSLSIGATTGVIGLSVYSGYKLYGQIKKNYNDYKTKAAIAEKNGQKVYKNYGQFLFSKENRKDLYGMVGAAAGSVISAGFGVSAGIEHGFASVSGFAGQIMQHGWASLGHGGAMFSNMFSNVADKVTNMNWETVGGMVKSVATNARVISSTSVSLTTGMLTSGEAARQQREAEEKLDKLLKEYGFTNLPTDKKTLKLRSSDPVAYITAVMKQNRVNISSENIKNLNSVCQEIKAKRKEKNMRRWGAVAGSGLGLAMAGFFGAKPEDLQEVPTTETTQELNGVQAASQEIPAGEEYPWRFEMNNGDNENGQSWLWNPEHGNDDMTIGEKLANMQSGEMGPEGGYQGEIETPVAEFDINSLSDEQKFKLEKLFERYPRAATLILEGNDNPAFTDVPSGRVTPTSQLKTMYANSFTEGADNSIPADRLEALTKFAESHFDEHGKYIGPDAEAFNAEAQEYTNRHQQTTKLADTEKETAQQPSEDQTENTDDNSAQKEETPLENADLTPDYSRATAEDGSYIINTEKFQGTYSFETVENGDATTYRERIDGTVFTDQDIRAKFNSEIVRDPESGVYSTAKGTVSSPDPNEIRTLASDLARDTTIRNEIMNQMLRMPEDQLTPNDQAFIRNTMHKYEQMGYDYTPPEGARSIESALDQKIGIQENDGAVSEPKLNDNLVVEDGQDNSQTSDQVAEEDSKGNTTVENSATAQEWAQINKKGINISYSIAEKDSGTGFSLSFKGNVSVDQDILNEMRGGLHKEGSFYTAANGAIRNTNYNIANMQVTNAAQNVTVRNAIMDDLLLRQEGTLNNAEKMFIQSNMKYYNRIGYEYTPPEGGQNLDQLLKEEIKVSSPNTPTVTEEATRSYSAPENPAVATAADGKMTTASGHEYSIDDKGNIIHYQVLDEAAQAKVEAEIFATLRNSKDLAGGALAFVEDYAKTNSISMETQSTNNLAANTPQSTTQAETPEISQEPKSKGTTNRYEDDMYYRPSKKTVENNGIMAANEERAGDTPGYEKEVTPPPTDNMPEESKQIEPSAPQSHGWEIGPKHRIWQYHGVKGTYAVVNNGSGPLINVENLQNVPQQLNLREHIRGTHEWNNNATYEEYLGGAVRGTPSECNKQLETVFKNIEGGDIAYRDLMHQIHDEGYKPTPDEAKWMTNFRRDLKSIGLDYDNTGKLQVIENANSCKARWYGTTDNMEMSQKLNSNADRYNRGGR